jgi:hypothetical protein
LALGGKVKAMNTKFIMQLTAIIILAVIELAAIVLAFIQKLHGMPIDPTAQSIIVAGVGYALTTLGFTHGVATANGVANDTATAVVKQMNESNQKS